MRSVLGAVLIVLAAVAVYRQSTTFGLYDDDYPHLTSAWQFDLSRSLAVTGRTHFYRPVVDLYFAGASSVCGRSARCFHGLSVGAHAFVSLLVAGLAAALSGRRAIGLVAGVLFAVQPAQVEAVTWVSASTEVLVTLFFVMTVWLFHRAVRGGSRSLYAASVAAFAASLGTHESSAVLLPVLALVAVLARQQEAAGPGPMRPRALWLTPFAVLLTGYLAVAYVINSQNYVVAADAYAMGSHVWRNAGFALVSFVVGRRELAAMLAVVALFAAAVAWGPARARFYGAWMVLALLPVLPFETGLAGRYLYLPAVGVAGLLAEVFWKARAGARRWRHGLAVWWIVIALVAGRFAVFAAKNVADADDGARYDRYAAVVRSQHPAPARGATLEVPAPPADIPDRYVAPLVRWTYGDGSLDVTIRRR